MADWQPGRFSRFRTDAVRGIDVAKAREMAYQDLEVRGRSPDEVAARAAYLDLLALSPGERVLEVGCGSGVVLRDVARRISPGGVAVGLDPSPAFLVVAGELAAQHGLSDVIELREGDVRALAFEDGEFDAVLAVTALLHVPDGERAIAEMVRVTRPGGRVAIFDRDNDSYIIAHPDRALTRRIVAAGSDNSAINSWIGRQAPGLLAEAGLRDVRVRAFASIEQDPRGFYATNAGARWADIAVQVGAISEAERQQWVEQLHAVEEAGGFVAGLTHLFSWGIRPD